MEEITKTEDKASPVEPVVMWRVDYNNDVDANDEGFWEWYEVTDGEKIFKCDERLEAEWLVNLLNERDRALSLLKTGDMTLLDVENDGDLLVAIHQLIGAFNDARPLNT